MKKIYIATCSYTDDYESELYSKIVGTDVFNRPKFEAWVKDEMNRIKPEYIGETDVIPEFNSYQPANEVLAYAQDDTYYMWIHIDEHDLDEIPE
jgi:hypothetical protein